MTSEKTPRYAVSTWLVLIMTAAIPVVALTGFSNFERGRQAVLVLGAAAALISWGLGLMRRRGATVHAVGVAGLGGAFFAMAGASFLWSSAPIFGVLSASTWVALGALVWVVLFPVGPALRAGDWALSVALGLIGAGALGLYDAAGGDLLTPVWNPPGIAGGFDGLGFAAAYYLVALPVVAGALARESKRGARFGVLAAGLALGTLHTALVVGPMDALVLVVGVALALGLGLAAGRRGESGARAGLGRLVAPLAVVVVGAALGLALVERPTSPSDATDLPRLRPSATFLDELAEDSSIRWPYFAIDRTEAPLDGVYRPYLNSVTRGLFEQEPVIGHGAGGWWLKQSDVIHDGDPHVRSLHPVYAAFKSPHSDFARLSVEQGALGVTLWALWLLGVILLTLGVVRRGELSREDVASFVGLTASFVVGLMLMFRSPLLELGSSAVVWTVATALLARRAAEGGHAGAWVTSVEVGHRGAVGRALLALVAALVGAAMIGPTLLNTLASLERGHGDVLMLRTRFAEAQEQYEEANRHYPAHADVLYNQALAYTLVGQTTLGEALIAEALELRPYDSRILSQGSYIALSMHRLDTALARGREAIRTGPNNLQAIDAYGAALQRRGRYEDAANLMSTLIKRGLPTREAATLHARLGQLYDQFLEQPRRALEHFNLAAKGMGDGPERMLVLNRVNELEKRIERERLIREGKPIPRHLLPQEVLEEGHDHGHDHGAPPGLPELPSAQPDTHGHQGHAH
ncbi:hypothetical protein DL240_06575 [Lujinxingia litoralis]|uniref:Uncharacterized protein n=1 Tax=Lujinxingia litoralis TaxID=2211119 RepID=A0A328CA01_9DELT|nr:hypothetical protein [Lujinxingia litoralis]RAL23814.1 hypothetical protein DL240_06575 [Lujinxingia litoralis]